LPPSGDIPPGLAPSVPPPPAPGAGGPAGAPARPGPRDPSFLTRFLLQLADTRPNPWIGLAVASLLLLAATGLRASLAPFFGTHARLIYFCPILMACGWLWGIRIGAFAAVLSLILGNFFFLPGALTKSLEDPQQLGEYLIYLLVGIVLAALASGSRTLLIRVRDSERGAAQLSQQQAAHLDRVVRERTSELAEAVEQLEAFSAGVAHDFRGPLRTISNYAEIIETEHGHELSDETRGMLRRILVSAERLNQLMADLLDYSRISLGEVALAPLPIEEALVPFLQDEELKKASIELVHPLGSVQANAAAFHQILANLLGNAVKFVRPGVPPRIKVWSERRGPVLRLWIEDNGIGIARADMPHIFDVFERLHAHETYPGTGIGLAMVRKAVHRMKGKVGVESEPGQGSRFWIELPVG
jgi:signal transduction histidine kinase